MSVQPRRDEESGVALVTVLMIVAAMSAVAIMLSSAVLASTSRAKALDASAQADWFVAGAEQFAEVAIEDIVSVHGTSLVAGMPALSQAMAFEVDGGLISVTGRDATNCYNINTLGLQPSGKAGGDGSELSAGKDFEQLLDLAEIDGLDSEAITAALTDWMDTDQSPGLSGAEDSYYRGLSPPYRTSGQPVENLSELRAIRYFQPGLVEALAPLLCAYPGEAQQALNINTLQEREAPLLSLAMSGALSVKAARDIIFQRPQGGWESVSAMLELPELAQISPDLHRTGMLSVQSRYIGVRTVIEYRGLRRIYDLVLMVEENGTISAIRRERKG